MTDLSGKKLLIIGGAFQHCKLVEAAHAMGVIVYVLDYLPVEDAPAKQIADKHFEYNITDYDKIVEMCKEEKIDGVLASHLDACQIPYQVVCERLGVPCFGTKEQYHILTDKTAFLKTCQENGVDIIPQYNESDFDTENSSIEYPLFVKPCDSRGSRGQTICENYSDMKKAIEFAKSESKTGKVIIEKYMKGKQEFTMSYLFVDGEPYLLRTGDRFVGAKADKMDKSAIFSLSPSMKLDIFLNNANKKVISMIKGIGIKNGPVFMQGFVDGEKIDFFDPGLRFPGCEYDRMYKQITGIDVCKYLVEFALTGKFPKETESIDKEARLNGKLAMMLFIVVKPGKIISIEGLDRIKTNPKIISIAQRYFEGDEVEAHYNVNQRFCEIDMITDGREEAKEMIDWIYSTLKILNENNEDMKMSLFNTKLL